MEPVGPADDEPDLVVERLVAGVGEPETDRRENAISMFAERPDECHEGLQAAALGLRAKAIEQLRRRASAEVAVEDRTQRLFQRVRPPEAPAAAAELAELKGLPLAQLAGGS